MVAEPTLFMDAKFKYTVRYFCSFWRAYWWGRRYLRENPCGEVCFFKKKRRGLRDGGARRTRTSASMTPTAGFPDRPRDPSMCALQMAEE